MNERTLQAASRRLEEAESHARHLARSARADTIARAFDALIADIRDTQRELRRTAAEQRRLAARLGRSSRLGEDNLRVAVEQVKSDLDSLSELGEMESLRLQMAMDRLSKFLSTLSNLMKKMSETQQALVQNLK